MKISRLLAQPGPTFSFEFFPPKDEAGANQLLETIQTLGALSPSFVSVTYGAGGSTRRRTIDLVKQIARERRIETMAHLTCVGASREEIAATLDELAAAGLDNVLALRGDPPKGESEFRPPAGGFAHASDLAAFIRERYSFCLGGACYPEGHPECRSIEQNILHLKIKIDCGVEFLITQLFFVNEEFFRFREKAALAGINAPIIAGLMPIGSLAQIQRIGSLCGAKIPASLVQAIENAASSEEARAIGIEYSTVQCAELLREGVDGIHFYTLNRSTATRAIWARLTGGTPPEWTE